MHRYLLELAFATLCLHLLFDSASCTVDICSPLVCKSDLPTSHSGNENSGSGAVGLAYVLDVEQQENHIAVEISISGSWHYTDPGPSGYMLDVFQEGNPERYIGQFADPDPQLSAKACSGGKTITFKSCHPTVLDLPGKYQWTPVEDVSRPICFRATIQNAEDSSCQTIVECRSFNLSSNNPNNRQAPTESVPSLIVSNVTPSPELVAKCHRKHNCTGTKLKDFCCSDGKTYASRCHKRIAECIYKTELQCHKGKCPPEPEPEPVPEGPCTRDSAWYQWDVMCNCDGYFKPIQCHDNICWCVNKIGEQKSATVTFEGSDKLTLSCF